MKHLVPLLLIIALWSADCAAQSEADKDTILQTFESWNRGWAEGDPDLAVQDYAENTDWTNAFGDRFQGKKALREGLAYIFGLGFVMAGESAGNEFNDVTLLSPDVEMVCSKLVRTGQQTSAGEAMPDRHINHLRVYQKRDGRWLIVSHLISQAKRSAEIATARLFAFGRFAPQAAKFWDFINGCFREAQTLDCYTI